MTSLGTKAIGTKMRRSRAYSPEQVAVARIDARGDRRLVILQRLDARQIAAQRIDIAAKRKNGDDNQAAQRQTE